MTPNRLSSAISCSFLLLSAVHSRPCSATDTESQTVEEADSPVCRSQLPFACCSGARTRLGGSNRPSQPDCLFPFVDITVRDLPTQLCSLPQSLGTLKVETQRANFQLCEDRKHMLKSCDMSVNRLLAASVLLRTKLFFIFTQVKMQRHNRKLKQGCADSADSQGWCVIISQTC